MPFDVEKVEVRGEIGAGATGRVWQGVLTAETGGVPAATQVALKRLHPELRNDARALAALRREAEIGSKLRHAGLVRVLGSGSDAQGPWLVSALVPGRTLRHVLDEDGPLPEPVLRSVAAGVSGGLAALHSAGWVHGDVKLENMRLDQAGRAVLLDLGFARKAGEAPANTPAGGSLAYLSPERARGELGGQASDVFSLGVCLWELATGQHPFALDDHRRGGTTGMPMRQSLQSPGGDLLLARIAEARVLPPSRFVPQLSPFLDLALEETLRRDPPQRPSARELARRFAEQEQGAWWRETLDRTKEYDTPVGGGVESAGRVPFVGRERELAELQEHYARAVESAEPRGGVLWLAGGLGSGKSRLMSEFATRVRTTTRPPIYLYGRCSRRQEERPAAPLLRLLQRWLRLPLFSGVPGARERAQLDHLVPPTIAATLMQALDPRFEGSTAVSVSAALAQWLVELGKRERLLVFLDDVTFAGEATLAVLARAAPELARSHALLVLGERTHERAKRPEALARLHEQLADAPRLELAPLDEAAVLRMVERLFHRAAPRLRIAQVLWSRSRGNPGMIAEILRGLSDRGQAETHAGGGLVLSMPPESLPLPASLPRMIRERYRALPDDDRRWLRRLCVVGGRIAPEFLVRAFPPTARVEIDAVLSRLVRSGWLEPAGSRYRFARPALREALYRSLRDDRRARYHACAARALAPRHGSKLTLDDAFQRAFHLRAAGDHAALMRVLPPLLDAVSRRGQPQRVLVLARWGVAAVDALAPTKHRTRMRIAFLEAAADASDRLGQREEQRRWLDKLAELSLSPETDVRSRETLVRIYLLHGRYAAGTGQYGLARGYFRQAVQLAEGLRDESELPSEALRRLSAVQEHVGELAEARELARRALERAVHEPQRAVALLQVALIQLIEDEIEPALLAVDQALRHLRRASDWNLPGVFAAAHMLRGRIYRIAGRPARALGAIQHAARLAVQAGERRLEAEAIARMGGLLLDLSRAEEAEARLREALLIAGEIEDRRGQALAGVWLGILLWEADNPEAEQRLVQAARLAEETGLERVEALCLAILARIARAAGDLEHARHNAERAQEISRRVGAEIFDLIVIHGTLALVLRTAGEEGKARDLERDIQRRVRRVNQRFTDPGLRQRHGQACARLIEAVRSPAGVIYPRVSAGSLEPS